MSDDVVLQAEVVGGARVDAEGGIQKPGYLIRDFILTSSRGARVQISDRRGRSNLVLVFAGCASAASDFLSDVARQQQRFGEQEAMVIALFQLVPQDEQFLKTWATPPLLLLSDQGGRVHRRFGAVDQEGKSNPVIYVTDRYGEIASVFVTRKGEQLPTAEQLLKTLEFINSRCPECEPPEWPR